MFLRDWVVIGLALGAAAVGTGVGTASVALAQGFADQPAVMTPADPQLTDSVVGALAKDEALGLDNIQVTAQNGVVELNGIVGNDFERDRAIRDARGVAGVARVDENISIQPRDY